MEIYLDEVQRLATGTHGILILKMQPLLKSTTGRMDVLCTCINVFFNDDCTSHPILLFIRLQQSLFQNIPLKVHLIQR